MSISKERTQELIKVYGKMDEDSGTSDAQIAILTERIRNITEHLKTHKKDHSGRRGLLKLVWKRRKLLNYIQKRSQKHYVDLIAKLGIRK